MVKLKPMKVLVELVYLGALGVHGFFGAVPIFINLINHHVRVTIE